MIKAIAAFFLSVFFLSVVPIASVANEWPAGAKAQIQAAGDRFTKATTIKGRVAALREISRIAAAFPEAEGAKALALLARERAIEIGGPTRMLAALGELKAKGKVTDPEVAGRVASAAISTAEELRDNGTLWPSGEDAVRRAIVAYDDAAKKANMPSFSETIGRAIGSPEASAKLSKFISTIQTANTLKEDTTKLKTQDHDATNKFVADTLDAFSSVSPAFSGPGAVLARHFIVYSTDLTRDSANGINVVADAIGRGHIDNAKLAESQQALNTLFSKGPVNGKVMQEMLQSLCDKIPVGGAWCKEAFSLGQKAMNEFACSWVGCDCDSIPTGGSLIGGLNHIKKENCLQTERALIDLCHGSKKVVGSCAPYGGPAAFPK